jgi:hypothetical protein
MVIITNTNTYAAVAPIYGNTSAGAESIKLYKK